MSNYYYIACPERREMVDPSRIAWTGCHDSGPQAAHVVHGAAMTVVAAYSVEGGGKWVGCSIRIVGDWTEESDTEDELTDVTEAAVAHYNDRWSRRHQRAIVVPDD